MVPNSTAPIKAPRFPIALAVPLGLIPQRVHSGFLVVPLNRLFAEALRYGDLDFLEGRVLEIRVVDARLCLRLTLRCSRLEAASDSAATDTAIEGTAFDFLRLATRQEDADTLFFHRRLRFAGDTELGLFVKNFLDTFEPPSNWEPLFEGAGFLARRIGG